MQLVNKKTPNAFPKDTDSVYNFFDLVATALANDSKYRLNVPQDYLTSVYKVVSQVLPNKRIRQWMSHKGVELYDPIIVGNILSMDEVGISYLRAMYTVPMTSELSQAFSNDLDYYVDIVVNWQFFMDEYLDKHSNKIDY